MNTVTITDIIDWLDENQPVYADKLRDTFGVNHLDREVDEDALVDAICDNDRVYEMLYQEFPEYFDDTITSATSTFSIDPNLDIITGEDNAENISEDIETLMNAVNEELLELGVNSTTYYEKIDSIYLIVYDSDSNIYEFTIPKADLTSDFENNVNYIVDAVIPDINT